MKTNSTEPSGNGEKKGFDPSKYKITKRGLEIPSGEALRKELRDFPTYDDILREHNEYFGFDKKAEEIKKEQDGKA